MRKFSVSNAIGLFVGLAILQIPWLLGLIPLYRLIGLKEPVGGLIWLYGFLYCLVCVYVIFVLALIPVITYIVFNILFPKESVK